MILVGNFIWTDLYPSNGNKIFPVINLDGFDDSFDYQWTSGVSKRTVGNITVTSAMAKDWYINLRRKILATTTVSQLERHQKLLAILAMKLLRYLINDATTLEGHILQTATNLAKKFVKSNINMTIPPPNRNCEEIKLMIELRQQQTATVFAMLSHAMMNESAATYKQYAPIMLTSCMVSFQNFGFGPFKWLFSASKYHKMKPEAIIDYFKFNITQSEYERIEKHSSDFKDCKSWHYARLIDPEYFVDLNVADSPRLTMIFALLSKPKTEWDEIKKIKSLEKGLRFVDFAERCATAFLEIKRKSDRKLMGNY